MLSPNEVRARAAKFSKDWEDAHREKSDTHSFYNEFFQIFGIKTRNVAIYEKQVKKLDNKQGFIDLFWPKVLLVEQKSKGKDLKDAKLQADEYFLALEEELRPRYILASDFQNFDLFDLDKNEKWSFTLSKLADNIELFEFMQGIVHPDIKKEDPVSIEAAEIMGGIYDSLRKSGYDKHDMEYLLTRLTYCLFADDTDIFVYRIFEKYLKNRTSKDGSDLGAKLIQLFQVLNTPIFKRQEKLDEDLAKFPYIDGDLFRKPISIPAFDSRMRVLLIKASEFDWARVSPAIFGSLFQSVMDSEERRAGGSHYTMEENILKVIKPLFLDELRQEFQKILSEKSNRRDSNLEKFQNKLASLKFLDPACGSGNFLIIAYREIRRLELEVIKLLHPVETKLLDVSILSKVNVNQFYGIEITEFSSRISETALWMMDHLMNRELSAAYGLSYARIPLKEHPSIKHGDALEIDWNDLLPSSECSYIFGNPPFAGSNVQSKKQKEQIRRIAGMVKSSTTLDYVAAWFLKAVEYIPTHTHRTTSHLRLLQLVA